MDLVDLGEVVFVVDDAVLPDEQDVAFVAEGAVQGGEGGEEFLYGGDEGDLAVVEVVAGLEMLEVGSQRTSVMLAAEHEQVVVEVNIILVL